MATYHHPVLTWQDASGNTTAALAGAVEPAAACAPTEDEALQQLKDVLEWRAEERPWSMDPDLEEPVLHEVKVEIRTRYQLDRRLMPTPESLWLRVPCVAGKQQSGLKICVIPCLAIQFNYRDGDELNSLAAHYVKEVLQGMTPLQLAGLLPPRGSKLTELVLRRVGERQRRLPANARPQFKGLFAVATPLLMREGRKRQVSAAYGREEEAYALGHKLGQEKANVLLVGEPGVGKSTLLHEAVKQLARTEKSKETDDEEAEGTNASTSQELRRLRYWGGNGGRMIAGMAYLGEWEERCERFIKDLAAIEGVYCVENLLELVNVGGEGPGDSVAAFLMPYLQRRELRMVAEATPAEVEACRRLLPGLVDLFQLVHVEPFTGGTVTDILDRVAAAQASGLRLTVQPGVAELVRQLFQRFLPYNALPGPAAGFIRKLCDKKARGKTTGGTVTREDVIQLFIQQTGLPEVFLRDELPLPPAEVRAGFARQIIGQPAATDIATRLVAGIKTGLTDPGRPLGVLLFCGPTGVGKTALARALTEYCFGAAGAKDRLVRLDMSEYAGWGATHRFLQNQKGQPAAWIEKVRRQPFCVVLFDEIEKAAPEVFDVLLGLMDEGRLTDTYGRTTWFRSAIVIMTSNLGAGAPTTAGFGPASGPAYESEVSRFFRPEFFNRLDAVVTFNPLTREQIEAITRKELADLAGREGLAAAGIELRWSDALVGALAREGYDHQFGARPLQRTIERRIAVPLARWRVANAQRKRAVLTLDIAADGQVSIAAEARAANGGR